MPVAPASSSWPLLGFEPFSFPVCFYRLKSQLVCKAFQTSLAAFLPCYTDLLRSVVPEIFLGSWTTICLLKTPAIEFYSLPKSEKLSFIFYQMPGKEALRPLQQEVIRIPESEFPL